MEEETIDGHPPRRSPDPRLRGLVVGDRPEAWARIGFTVRDRRIGLGGVTIELVGDEGPRGLLGWDVETLPGAVDGLAAVAVEPATSSDEVHANGASAIDHVVVATADLDRTTSALTAAGLTVRRTVVGAQGDDALTYRFFLVGTAVLEVIAPTQARPHAGPARFVGLAVVIDDLDGLVTPWQAPRDAVQPGRRIATLDRGHEGISVPLAAMSPRSAGP